MDSQPRKKLFSSKPAGYAITLVSSKIDDVVSVTIPNLTFPKRSLSEFSPPFETASRYADVNGVNMSPFNSESFGGYSYSKSSGGAGDSTKDKSGTWQGAFGAELQPWRKI